MYTHHPRLLRSRPSTAQTFSTGSPLQVAAMITPTAPCRYAAWHGLLSPRPVPAGAALGTPGVAR